MKRLFCLMLAVLCLAGCRPMHPIAETAPALTTAAPTTQPAETALPTETTPETTQPMETTTETEPVLRYVEVFREGEASQIPVEMVHGTVGSYAVAMDPEYFTFYPQETVDMFSYDAWEDGPGVFYAISDYQLQPDPQQFVTDTQDQFAPLFDSCSTEETTIAGYPATAVYLSDFIMDPAYQYHVFLVDCQGDYYLIEVSFVFEMYEGLYPIIRACLDTMAPAE